MCDTDLLKPSNCIVYSIGSKSNYVFEKGLIERFNCEIHVFDPFLVESTERSLHAGIHLHSWGVDSESHDVLRRRRNGTTTTLQMKSLPDIVSALGHEGLIIDILKIDVEGFEVGILNDPGMWGQLKNISTEFSQVLAEIHLSGINRETFLWQNSSLYDGSQIDMLFREMTSQGYGLFHKEINALPVARMQCAEFGFVKINVDCKDLVSRPQSKFVYSPSLTAI